MSESELKPCNCGSANVWYSPPSNDTDPFDDFLNQWHVSCKDCGAMSGGADTVDAVTILWNHRPREAELEREVERLRERLSYCDAEARLTDFFNNRSEMLTRHRNKWAEIARGLKKQLLEGADCNHQAMGSIERLEAENKRLREALTDLKGLPFRSDIPPSRYDAEYYGIIEKALEGGNE